MLSAISIQNFRCFSNLKVEGFKNINLIGGENNVGKTALLEALTVANYPTPNSISLLRLLRKESDYLIRTATDSVWDYFFFDEDKTKEILFTSNFENGTTNILSLFCKPHTQYSTNIGSQLLEKPESKFYITSLLNVKGDTQKTDYDYHFTPNKESGKLEYSGEIGNDLNYPPFLTSTFQRTNNALVQLYSKLKVLDKIKEFNEILCILDNRIIGSEIDAPGGEPIIKLQLNNYQLIPLGMFGDAVQKIAELLLVLFNSPSSTIIIDEIENGIHYTKQKELWTKLFEVIGDNIQIFATSHSLEMITAFNEVAYKTKFEDKAMYFEMARVPSSGEIFANPINMKKLNYKLASKSALRGE